MNTFAAPVAAQAMDLLEEIPDRLQRLDELGLDHAMSRRCLHKCRKQCQGRDVVASAVITRLQIEVGELLAHSWHEDLAWMDTIVALEAGYELAQMSGALHELLAVCQQMLDEGRHRLSTAA